MLLVSLDIAWEPWAYWRTVTLVLACFWTFTAIARLAYFHARWEKRLEEFGASRPWLRRQLMRLCLRVTILDPTNLALMLFIASLWSIPRLWLGH